MAGTSFSAIYNRFLGKITDDMYLELTPQDTVRDLQRLLIDAIPGFEFPRKNIQDYTIKIVAMTEDNVEEDDFVMGMIWYDLGEASSEDLDMETLSEQTWVAGDGTSETSQVVVVEKSFFATELTSEEINILACLMKQGWVQRQVSSIENTRMKYSGSDFKMTSQANHLQKLLTLLEEARREQFHAQRLYKRRKLNDDGEYVSNWSILNHHNHNNFYVD